MIRWRSGNTALRSHCISDRISYCLDSEISPPHPKSWSAGVFEKAFSEGDEEPAGL